MGSEDSWTMLRKCLSISAMSLSLRSVPNLSANWIQLVSSGEMQYQAAARPRQGDGLAQGPGPPRISLDALSRNLMPSWRNVMITERDRWENVQQRYAESSKAVQQVAGKQLTSC